MERAFIVLKESQYYKELENDIKKFDKALCEQDVQETRKFKARSEIAKDFAQKCAKDKIVINLFGPRDYFEGSRYCAYRYIRFLYEDKIYLKIDDQDINSEIPEGFTDIKLSEFYEIYEKFKDEQSKENEGGLECVTVSSHIQVCKNI